MSEASETVNMGEEVEQGELVQLSREELETFRMQMKAMALVAKVGVMLKKFVLNPF